MYLAYFAPGYVKAGISSETRGIERLLEQGARAARVVGRFTCADDARALEAALCAQEGVAETMRASLKAKLLADASYSFNAACHDLGSAADRLENVDAVAQAGFAPEDALDLSPYYFGGPSPDAHTMQLPEGEGFADVCGGVCAGMVGANLVFWQDGTNFIAPIKDWESHEIEFLDDAALRIVLLHDPTSFKCKNINTRTHTHHYAVGRLLLQLFLTKTVLCCLGTRTEELRGYRACFHL